MDGSSGARALFEAEARALKHAVIGHPVARVDALEKATGRATYAADLRLAHALVGKVLRSRYPHALVRNIDTSRARALPGVHAVLTAKDIPGVNRYGLAFEDQRVLADHKVRCVLDALALVAAESEEIALEALELIWVDYEELPALFNAFDALKPEAPRVHDDRDNLIQHVKVRKGDVDRGFREAAVIVENTYRTHVQDHAYLEPEAGAALLDPTGNLTVWSSTQYPFRDRRQIAPVVALDFNRVRVIATTSGGAFGGKDDITLELYLALLALKTRRPLKMVNSREESFFSHTKRHPLVIQYKSGASREGKLTAIEVQVYGDTGAYCSLGPYVVKKSGLHSTGPYFVPNVKVDAYCVYTNNPTFGPMRGFGILQASVAHEAQMDALAERLGMSPLQIRMVNALDRGLSTATGQVLYESIGIKPALRYLREYMEATGLAFQRGRPL